jgi:hypothetical protein
MKRRNHLKYLYNILFPASLQVAFRDAAPSIASSGASVFVDELAGYSTASLDSVRHVTATGDFALGAFTETGAGIAKPPLTKSCEFKALAGNMQGKWRRGSQVRLGCLRAFEGLSSSPRAPARAYPAGWLSILRRIAQNPFSHRASLPDLDPTVLRTHTAQHAAQPRRFRPIVEDNACIVCGPAKTIADFGADVTQPSFTSDGNGLLD